MQIWPDNMRPAPQVTKPKDATKPKKPIAKKAKVAKPTSAKKVGIPGRFCEQPVLLHATPMAIPRFVGLCPDSCLAVLAQAAPKKAKAPEA